MFKETSLIFKSKTFVAIFLFPILLLGFFIVSARAEGADHLVISAAQITEGDGKTTHDFIEIYNPTNKDINLKGYRLVKRTEEATKDDSIKSWASDTYIQARDWRLWASSSDALYPASISADDFTKDTIADDTGVAIRFGKEDMGEVIDSLAWGAAENIFKEGMPPANPAVSEAFVRKPGNGSNGEDTGNNAGDFFIVSNYKPHNSGGYAPALSSPTPTPAVSANPGSQSSSNSANDGGLLKPLVAEAGADKEAAIGQTVFFDGSDSYDPEGKVLEYNWDFGDGTKAMGVSASHIFNSAGELKAILKIISGSRAAEDFLAVKIIEPDFSDKVILSEILPDPDGLDKDGEWIEIYNGGDKKVNLKSWMLDDKIDGGARPHVFADDAFIEAKSFLVVPRSKSKIVLANAGGEVNLLWHNGKNLSKVSYGAAKEGQSYALISGAWQWTETPSAGKENSLKDIELAIQPKKMESILQAKAAENIMEVSGEIIKAGKPEQNIEADNQIFNETVLEEEAPDEIIAGDIKTISKNLGNANSGNLGNSNNGNDNQAEEKNNPWFWGNMALSVMSLFLVWRYQILKKKVK